MTASTPFTTRGPLRALVAVTAGLILLTACSSSSSGKSDPPPATPHSGGSSGPPATTNTGDTNKVDGCSLLTAAELSQAAGITYTGITSSGGTLCSVTGASVADSFTFAVNKEDGALTTWAGEVKAVTDDDSTAMPVSGYGDRAIQGGVKEFAAEAHGYIVSVIGADFNNPATAKDFTRTKKIVLALIAKL